MNQDLSIFALVAQASLIVQLVMASLLIVSIASWSVIFSKLFGLAKVRKANDAFEQEFWSGRNLNELYQGVSHKNVEAPLARIFAAGMREFLKLRERRVTEQPRVARVADERGGDEPGPGPPGVGLDGLELHALAADRADAEQCGAGQGQVVGGGDERARRARVSG